MRHVFDPLKQLYLDARILWHFRELNPASVTLPPYGHRVFVDPRDRRARKMLLADTIRGKYRRNRDFWLRATERFAPDLAIDVGVNFGEVLFLPQYGQRTRIIGVEANPILHNYLEQSRQHHPGGDRIELYQAIAAGESGPAIPFHVDQDWSGGSTAAAGVTARRGEHLRTEMVATVSIDDLVARQESISGQRVLFKIDVEGYEPLVFSGMGQTLRTAASVLGFIEFDVALLIEAGVDASEFWDQLQGQFEVWMFTGPRGAMRVNRENLQQAAAHFGRKNLHTDLVLARHVSRDVMASLMEPWTTQRRAA